MLFLTKIKDQTYATFEILFFRSWGIVMIAKCILSKVWFRWSAILRKHRRFKGNSVERTNYIRQCPQSNFPLVNVIAFSCRASNKRFSTAIRRFERIHNSIYRPRLKGNTWLLPWRKKRAQFSRHTWERLRRMLYSRWSCNMWKGACDWLMIHLLFPHLPLGSGWPMYVAGEVVDGVPP